MNCTFILKGDFICKAWYGIYLNAFSISAEEASLKRLMNIKIIHLVDDEGLLPNAIVDCYWEKLLKKDALQCEDWGDKVL